MKGQTMTSKSKTLAEFDDELAAMSLRGQWVYDAMLERLIGGPNPCGKPHLWRWDAVNDKLIQMLDLMSESFTARRNVSFINPNPDVGGTTQTILMGMQIVKPGEVAWSHRHPISALRFVIDGDEKLYTVVDGEPLVMETNDLVLTPTWTWHDHHNESDKVGIWLDVLDVPLVKALGQMAYEPLGESTQGLLQPDAYPSARANPIRPQWEPPNRKVVPYRYAWRDVEQQLRRFAGADGSPYDGVILEYANPATGGPTLPTLRCAVQSLRPGFAGKRHRKTSSTVFYVVEGEGSTIVGDTELKWGPRDVFSIPSWVWYEHRNRSSGSRAVLFSVSDAPLLESIDLYREEAQR
jgi:gentisate 1,2-dioxygenase